VTRGLASIKDYDARLVGEAEERKRQRLSKVKELESALRLARSDLSDLSKEEEREANIVSSRARHSNMVSRVSEAVTDLANLLAQTSTCWEAMRGSIQDKGIPAELWFQLKFVESCQIEGADEE
jgi:23S rRNA maturation-related 3'-5' exoribonuclease YhaM